MEVLLQALRFVNENASCELFAGQVPATNPFVQTLQGIAAGTSPFVCADLTAVPNIPISIG